MPAIPLPGDRSAFNADGYPTLHTNDTNVSASSLHHTLGTGAKQAASGSHTHAFSTISSGSAESGYVLTADGSGSAAWQPPTDGWKIALTQDENMNNSNKTFTVPVGVEWQLLWIWAEYTSSSVSGVRQLEIQLQDSGSDVIAQFQTGITQGANLAYKYMFGIAMPDLTALRDGNYLTTPLPAGTFLATGQKLKIWDNKAIDASEDGMIIQLQYAYRPAT